MVKTHIESICSSDTSLTSNSESETCSKCPNKTYHPIFSSSHENSNSNSNSNSNPQQFQQISQSNNSQIHPPICNKINIDVAVLCQEYTKIEKMCDDHIINLDEIEITKELFQYIFYPYCENFGINKNTICNNPAYIPYISFMPEYRTVNCKKFYLLEAIIANIESDLNVSRNCFTIESLVELTNEIVSINSFCDLNCCSVLSSLTWTNILEIVKNYNIINCDCTSITEPVIPICVISVVFKTPTCGVKNTIVRFNYRITDL
jgi:hypothetical protein